MSRIQGGWRGLKGNSACTPTGFHQLASPSRMQIPQTPTPRGDVMHSWQGVRGILASLGAEGDGPGTTPARSTTSRRSARSGRSGRHGRSGSPAVGEWSVDSIEEEEEEETGEETHGRTRWPHRRTDTDHTVRPAFFTDIAAARDQAPPGEGETPLSTSPEAEPLAVPKDPARLWARPSPRGKHVRTSVYPFRHPKADLNLAADTQSIALSRTPDRAARTITDATL